MKFNARRSRISQRNGDYETIGTAGGYRHFPDRSMKKGNLALLVKWLTLDGGVGIIRLDDGRSWDLVPENHDVVLVALWKTE